MDKNRIIAYSLLAHINDNEAGIRDLTDIFKPLVKRALSRLTVEGRLEGKFEDVKEKIDSLYSLDIPFPYLEQILKKLAREFVRESGVEFVIFQDGSYTSNKFVFAEYEDFLAQQEAELDAIQSSFERYAIASGQSYENPPSIFAFIDEYRLDLISYIATSEAEYPERLDDAMASFLQTTINDRNLFMTFRRIYLGSIIASYLSLNTDTHASESIEFLFDTNLLIGLIDLGTEVSYHSCTKLLELCRKLGHPARVMDLTIEELENLLTNHADYWPNNFFWERQDPHSIYNACHRRGITRTDLYSIIQSIPKRLVGRLPWLLPM